METVQIIMAVIFGGAFLSCIVIPLWLKIEEKNNSENKESKGCLNLVIAVVIVILVLFIMGMCGGDGMPWSPRHT